MLLLLLCAFAQMQAQVSSLKMVRIDSTIMRLNKMTVADYANLEIPSLEVMFDNARRFSNAPKYYQYEAEYYKREVKTLRKKPLEWIRLMASYNYGNMDMAAIALMETTYAVWTQNQSSQTNSYFSVGAGLTIPLSDIFDMGNKVKQAQARVKQNEARYNAEIDNIKNEIVTLYCDIYKNVALLKSIHEGVINASAQYQIAQMNFANNMITAEDLYRSKSFEEEEIDKYEKTKAELNADILSLEIISCTPIISDFIPGEQNLPAK